MPLFIGEVTAHAAYAIEAPTAAAAEAYMRVHAEAVDMILCTTALYRDAFYGQENAQVYPAKPGETWDVQVDAEGKPVARNPDTWVSLRSAAMAKTIELGKFDGN